MSDTNVADRLKAFIEMKGLSYSQFADSCGIPRPSLSQLLTGRNKKINDIMVGQIHNTFPELSIVWLLFGEGPMINNINESNNLDELQSYDSGLHSQQILSGPGLNKIVFTDSRAEITQNPKENGLNEPINRSKEADIQLEKLQNKIKELKLQIDNLRNNPRKAVQIMVYYDDSTFETFYPR